MTPGKIQVASSQGIYVLNFSGDVRLTLCTALEEFVNKMFEDGDLKSIIIDLSDVDGLDSTTLGQLAKISILSREKLQLTPSIISPKEDITKLLKTMGFHKIFYILGQLPTKIDQLDTIECSHTINEDDLRDKIIEAHKVLIELNEDNREAFQNLVDSLESDRIAAQYKQHG